jgi:hypothetical protein
MIRWCGQMLSPPSALLAIVPHALVRADARFPALLASAPPALVRADARPSAIFGPTPCGLLSALFASAPPALVRADSRPPALLALAPDSLMRADARPPALLAMASGLSAAPWLNRGRPGSLYSIIDSYLNTNNRFFRPPRVSRCVSSVYFLGHRAKPLTGLNRRAPKGRPTRKPPP